MLEYFKGGIPGRSQAHLGRGCFTFHGQHVPGRDHGCALRVRVQAKLAARAFDFPDMFHASPFLFPRHWEAAKLPLPEGRCTLHPCHQGEAPCYCWSKQWRGDTMPTPEIFPDSYFCELFPFWTGNRLSFALVWGGILQGERRGKGEAEGLFFFLQEEQFRQACLKLKWQHKGA